ncbi:MAG: efflux RND transporter periplasmic adaptor subunit [Planctomycetota bacterium]
MTQQPTPPPSDLSRLSIQRPLTDSSRRGGAPWLLWVLVLGVILYLALDRTGLNSRRTPGAGSADSRELSIVSVSRNDAARTNAGISTNGYVVARRRAAISTEISGRIVELRVEEGQRVSANELLGRLDSRQLEAALARERADLVALQAEARLAQLRCDRERSLLATRSSSQQQVDEAQAELEAAIARCASATAAILETEVQIDKSSVYAPFAGVVILKNAEIGEVVAATGGGGNARGAVATIVDFDTLEVQVELAQTSLRSARTGAPVQIFLDAFAETPLAGHVRQVWPTADRQKATVELRITFDQIDPRVLPDMGARVVFMGDGDAEHEPTRVRVPRRALVTAAGKTFVYVVSAGRVARRAIEIASDSTGDSVSVSAGLDGFEQVVLDAPPDLADGDAVRSRSQ